MSGSRNTTADLDVDLGQLFGSLARRWKRVLAVTLAAAATAFVLASLAKPQYRAETRLIIEARESVFTRTDVSPDADRPILDEEGVTSQVEVITSTDILTGIAKKFDFANLPEFRDEIEPSIAKRLAVLTGLANDPAEIPPEERVLNAFRDKLKVYRVEKSRVIVVQFSSRDAKLAAEVPNAVADAYLALQKDAKLQSNSDATAWLAPEIEKLTERVKQAEAKVAAFRGQSDLLMGQNNSVLATQQLSELSTELSRVRAQRGAAEASAASVRSAIAKGGSLDALPDVLSSNLIQRLRERQVQLKAQVAELSTTLLEGHPRIRALRSQLADLDAQVRAAARNVLESLATEVQTAKLREQQLVSDLNTLKAASARAGEDEVEARALEREAAAQRDLLESYLTRYREASSRRDGNYLPADARVFSRATQPVEPYFPKVVPITVAAAVAALLLTAVVVLLQELFSGRAMRPAQGSTPVSEVAMPAAAEPAFAPAEDVGDAPAEVFEQEAMGVAAAAERLLAMDAKRAIFVSPEGDEAAAAAVLVARAVSDAGLRVLLLDLSASGAASTPMLDTASHAGITDLLAAEAQFADIIRADHYSDCHVIPAGTADPVRAMRAADRLPIIMESLTTAYDLVVVECGATDAEGIRRLIGERTLVLVGILDPAALDVIEALVALDDHGLDPVPVIADMDMAGRFTREAA